MNISLLPSRLRERRLLRAHDEAPATLAPTRPDAQMQSPEIPRGEPTEPSPAVGDDGGEGIKDNAVDDVDRIIECAEEDDAHTCVLDTSVSADGSACPGHSPRPDTQTMLIIEDEPTSSARDSPAHDMARRHTLRQLREMALEHGISQYGKKLEVCERLIAAQLSSPGESPE